MFQTSVFMKTTTNLVFFQGQPRKLIMALDAVRKQLPALAIMQHTPKCYRTLCNEYGSVPLCTCNTCRGERTHPGDQLDGSNNQASTPTPSVPTFTPIKRQRLEEEEVEEEKTPKITESSDEDRRRSLGYHGKVCIICLKKQKCKTLPIIRIGPYCTMTMQKSTSDQQQRMATLGKPD
jgi:hypothetical protein